MSKKIIQKLLLSIIILSVILSFCGCSLYISSIDKLMKPPMFDIELEKTINKKIGADITILTPSKGNDDEKISYLSSNYNYVDIDSDSMSEVITFYSKESTPDEIHMLILKYTNKKWIVVSDTIGQGSEIVSLAVVKLDAKSDKKQIITTWKYVDNMILSVYSIEMNKSDYELISIADNRLFDELRFVNIDEDEPFEMLVINYDSSVVSNDITPYVCVLEFNSATEKIDAIGEIQLPSDCVEIDCTVSEGYSSIPFVVFLDYRGKDKIYYSNIIYWNGYLSKLVSYNEKSLTTVESKTKIGDGEFLSSRTVSVKCSDVNSDNYPEIPFNKSFSYQPDENNVMAFTVWYQLRFTQNNDLIFVSSNDYRVYFDETNYFSLPAIFDKSKFYAKKDTDESWSFYYGDFNETTNDVLLEMCCFAKFNKIENSKVEYYKEMGYEVLGTYSDNSETSLVYKTTDYATQLNLTKNDFLNIK